MAVPGTSERFGEDSPRHVLAVPVSEEQRREQSSAFVAGGLAAGEQVSYFDDDGAADGVLERLADDGVDPDDPLRTGQLQIIPAEVTRATLRAPLQTIEDALGTAVDGALAAGWRGLRFTGALAHGLGRSDGATLSDVDDVVDRVVQERPARALCVYDQARFPASTIEGMRSQHTDEAPDDSVYDDALLRITRDHRGVARLAGEIDHSNRQQVRRVLEPMQDETLRGSAGAVDLLLDLTSLRFCDVATAVSLVHAAEELPSSHRLLLTGVRPRLARVLERCGSEAAPQLVIRRRRT